MDLSPASDPRLDAVAVLVSRHVASELGDELGPLGTGPDAAHDTAQHVDQLRELVEREIAQHTSGGRAPILALNPAGSQTFGRLELILRGNRESHGAELEHVERSEERRVGKE